MAEWDNYAADKYKTSDGRIFDTRFEADRHQDSIENLDRIVHSGSSSSSASSGPTYYGTNWTNVMIATTNEALKLIEAGDYDKAIEKCNKTIEYNPDKWNWYTKHCVGFAFTARGSAYYHKGMEEKALEDYTEAADYGYYQAIDILTKKYGVPYKRKRPKTWADYGFDERKTVPAYKENKKGPGLGLSLVAGAILGIGLAFSAGWIYLHITGAESLENEKPLFLIGLAVCALVSALFIGRKVWKIVIPLALLSVAGWLILFGVIPERVDLSKFLGRTAAVQTTSASVTSDGLNLRAEASGGAAVVKTLKKGDTVTVTGEAAEGWMPVEHDGDKGWVSSEYLESN